MRRPAQWYRTIDRVRPGLVESPKLLLPDLKARVHPVLDAGGHYPHHNLFWITSAKWDLEVLGGLLLSDVANAFVEMYSVRMASGCLRVSAQYLRRIRLPRATDVPRSVAEELASAFRARDREAASSITLDLLGLPTLPR
jgi:adenine-specific DNA-methyltransferase